MWQPGLNPWKRKKAGMGSLGKSSSPGGGPGEAGSLSSWLLSKSCAAPTWGARIQAELQVSDGCLYLLPWTPLGPRQGTLDGPLGQQLDGALGGTESHSPTGSPHCPTPWSQGLNHLLQDLRPSEKPRDRAPGTGAVAAGPPFGKVCPEAGGWQRWAGCGRSGVAAGPG